MPNLRSMIHARVFAHPLLLGKQSPRAAIAFRRLVSDLRSRSASMAQIMPNDMKRAAAEEAVFRFVKDNQVFAGSNQGSQCLQS